MFPIFSACLGLLGLYGNSLGSSSFSSAGLTSIYKHIKLFRNTQCLNFLFKRVLENNLTILVVLWRESNFLCWVFQYQALRHSGNKKFSTLRAIEGCKGGLSSLAVTKTKPPEAQLHNL